MFYSIFACYSITSCLIKGTLILTPNGLTPIERLKIGDKIISYDVSAENIVTNTVTKIAISKINSTIKVVLQNENIVEGTSEHPFYLPNKKSYLKMKNLKIGDNFLMKNGKKIAVKNIYSNHYHAPIKVYDISVSPLFHNYFAGNVLVHNKIFYIDFDNQDLSGQDLSGQDLSGRYFRGANLQNANLSNANLSNANLNEANLQNANLQNANLNGARFQYANLSDANLSDANLSDANLRFASLSSANLQGANLSNANFSHTLINGIMTNGALGITSSTFKEARP